MKINLKAVRFYLLTGMFFSCLFLVFSMDTSAQISEAYTLPNNPQTTSYSQQLSNRITPQDYLAKIEMYDNYTVYFVMPGNKVMGYDVNGTLMDVGEVEKPDVLKKTQF